MNIRVPFSWLTTYVELSHIEPQEVARALSCKGPSIDRISVEDGESIFEVEVTPNRPDLLSVVGCAREASAIFGIPLQDPFTQQMLAVRKKKALLRAKEHIGLEVVIEDQKSCDRYCGVVLAIQSCGPSPLWMQRALLKSGLRPINCIVDITNFVMLETGQPLHAFDASKLTSSSTRHHESISIMVRKGRQGEQITLLDGTLKILDPSIPVISDRAAALALAGIKGGCVAEITSQTRSIVLEAAHFDPVAIRRTSRDLDVRTDSSMRFERGLSSQLIPYAFFRAIELLREHAGAQIISRVRDVSTQKERISPVRFFPHTMRRVIGIDLSIRDITSYLRALGFQVSTRKKWLDVQVPFWRSGDVRAEIDLVEEVARLYGYDRIPRTPLVGTTPFAPPSRRLRWERETKEMCMIRGYTEVMSYSLTPLQAALRVTNPLSQEFEWLRTSMLDALFQVARDHQQERDALFLFEMGTVFFPTKGDLPHERVILSGVMMAKGSETELFRRIRGFCEQLTRYWFPDMIGALSEEGKTTNAFVNQRKARTVSLNDTPIGFFGCANSDYLKRSKIKHPCAVFEFDLDAVWGFVTGNKVMRLGPKFPAVYRDIAFVIPKNILYGEVEQFLRSFHPLIIAVELFDVYESRALGKDNKSFAIHLTYQSDERTLDAAEIDIIHARLGEMLKKTFNVALR